MDVGRPSWLLLFNLIKIRGIFHFFAEFICVHHLAALAKGYPID